MAPRNIVTKARGAAECSAEASKRRRIEFSDPIDTTFPVSAHLLNQPPPAQTTGATGLHQDEEQAAIDDELISSLIPRQSCLMGYHMTQMLRSVEDFWRRNLTIELKKIRDLEETLQEKEREVVKFRDLYYDYESKAFKLEEKLRRSIEGERFSNMNAVREEEVDSCLVDMNGALHRTDTISMTCLNCQRRPATMLWLPCRHLCVCLMCDRRVKTCPMCGVHKTETLMINMPRH